MAISAPKPLVEAQLLTAAAVIYYTGQSNQRAMVSSATLHNSDAAATITATIYLVPNAGAVGDSSEIATIALLPKETVIVSELIGKPISAGATIRALASTATKVNLYVGGTEFAVT